MNRFANNGVQLGFPNKGVHRSILAEDALAYTCHFGRTCFRLARPNFLSNSSLATERQIGSRVLQFSTVIRNLIIAEI